MFEQHHLHLSMKFAMQKIKADALTAQTVKKRLKDLLQVKIHFHFKSSVRGTLANWKLFLYDVRALVKQFGIPTYFLALS